MPDKLKKGGEQVGLFPEIKEVTSFDVRIGSVQEKETTGGYEVVVTATTPDEVFSKTFRQMSKDGTLVPMNGERVPEEIYREMERRAAAVMMDRFEGDEREARFKRNQLGLPGQPQ